MAGGRNRDYVVTGIPRCGSSLLASLLTQTGNTVCMNEVHGDVASLPWFLHQTRRSIRRDGKAPTKARPNGELVTSTSRMEERNTIRRVPVEADGHEPLGVKHQVEFVSQLDVLKRLGFCIVAIVRDPVYSLGSWLAPRMEDTSLQDFQHPFWEDVDFTEESLEGRAAEAWDWLAHRLVENSRGVLFVRYEDLVARPNLELERVCRFVGVEPGPVEASLESKNHSDAYPKLDRIRTIVRERGIGEVLGYRPVRRRDERPDPRRSGRAGT